MRRLGFLPLLLSLALSPGTGRAQDDIKQHPECKYCGMDREEFAHSRVFIESDDGTTEGTCSLHCAAIDLAVKTGKTPKSIWVADYYTKRLIDVEKAFWVIGGSKPGVMTKRGKWAFATKEEAGKFQAQYGGDQIAYEQAIKATYEDMYTDIRMIREKKTMVRRTQHKQ